MFVLKLHTYIPARECTYSMSDFCEKIETRISATSVSSDKHRVGL